jgi:hypothetical protein
VPSLLEVNGAAGLQAATSSSSLYGNAGSMAGVGAAGPDHHRGSWVRQRSTGEEAEDSYVGAAPVAVSPFAGPAAQSGLEDAVTALRLEVQQLSLIAQNQQQQIAAALAAQQLAAQQPLHSPQMLGAPMMSGGSGGGGRRGGGAGGDMRKCYNCGGMGHLSRVCPQPPTAATLRYFGGNGNQPPQQQHQQQQPPQVQIRCQRCNEPGHGASSCRAPMCTSCLMFGHEHTECRVRPPSAAAAAAAPGPANGGAMLGGGQQQHNGTRGN